MATIGTSGERALVDAATLRELVEICGREFVEDLVAVFVEDAPRRVAAVKSALARGDLTGVSVAAHAMRGAAGQLGATGIVLCAEGLEARARRAETERLPADVAELERTLALVRVELEAFFTA